MSFGLGWLLSNIYFIYTKNFLIEKNLTFEDFLIFFKLVSKTKFYLYFDGQLDFLVNFFPNQYQLDQHS